MGKEKRKAPGQGVAEALAQRFCLRLPQKRKNEPPISKKGGPCQKARKTLTGHSAAEPRGESLPSVDDQPGLGGVGPAEETSADHMSRHKVKGMHQKCSRCRLPACQKQNFSNYYLFLNLCVPLCLCEKCGQFHGCVNLGICTLRKNGRDWPPNVTSRGGSLSRLFDWLRDQQGEAVHGALDALFVHTWCTSWHQSLSSERCCALPACIWLWQYFEWEEELFNCQSPLFRVSVILGPLLMLRLGSRFSTIWGSYSVRSLCLAFITNKMKILWLNQSRSMVLRSQVHIVIVSMLVFAGKVFLVLHFSGRLCSLAALSSMQLPLSIG